MAANEPLIEIVNGRVPGQRIHLEDINYVVRPGDHILVDGPSGSGKSKFLRMITGLMEPSEGWVLFRGRPFTYALDEDYFEERAGICFFLRGLAPISTLSVYENMEIYFRMCTDFDEELIQESILERLHLLHLADKADQEPDYLTDEERQLLALAMNLKMGGDLYVIDGVLTSLKPENQKIAMKLLSGIDFSRATVLVNMQDNHILGLEGNRLLRMENGHIAYDGQHQPGSTVW